MKVRVSKSVSGFLIGTRVYSPGETVEIDDQTAKSLLERGLVEPLAQVRLGVEKATNPKAAASSR